MSKNLTDKQMLALSTDILGALEKVAKKHKKTVHQICADTFSILVYLSHQNGRLTEYEKMFKNLSKVFTEHKKKD